MLVILSCILHNSYIGQSHMLILAWIVASSISTHFFRRSVPYCLEFEAHVLSNQSLQYNLLSRWGICNNDLRGFMATMIWFRSMYVRLHCNASLESPLLTTEGDSGHPLFYVSHIHWPNVLTFHLCASPFIHSHLHSGVWPLQQVCLSWQMCSSGTVWWSTGGHHHWQCVRDCSYFTVTHFFFAYQSQNIYNNIPIILIAYPDGMYWSVTMQGAYRTIITPLSCHRNCTNWSDSGLTNFWGGHYN